MHRGGRNNDQRVVGDFLLLLGQVGRGEGSGQQTAGERELEQSLVQLAEEHSQRGYVLD
jgi:hypothetical protein